MANPPIQRTALHAAGDRQRVWHAGILISLALLLFAMGCVAREPGRVAAKPQAAPGVGDVPTISITEVTPEVLSFELRNESAACYSFLGYGHQYPLPSIEVLTDGKWVNDSFLFCGTGLGLHLLPPVTVVRYDQKLWMRT